MSLGLLRARRELPRARREPRGGHQVLRARRVLVGVLPLRRGPRLRRHRLDQPLDDRRRVSGTVPVERNDALVLAGIALLLVGLGVQDRRRAVPRLGARRVPGRADAGHRRSWRRSARSAAFAALVRVFVVALPYYRDDWRPVIWVLAVLSLVVGSFLAVVQTDVKRMLAYSSISHAGFILVGRRGGRHRAGELDSGLGVPSVARLPARLRRAGDRHVRRRGPRRPSRRRRPTSTRSAGSASSGPVLALALTVFLVAQAGVPFTSGFIAKFGVIRAAVEEHSYALAIIAMVALGHRRVPVPADHGQHLDDPIRRPRTACRRRCASRSPPAWRSSPPPPSRCSSASSPAWLVDAAEHDHRRSPADPRFGPDGGRTGDHDPDSKRGPTPVASGRCRRP